MDLMHVLMSDSSSVQTVDSTLGKPVHKALPHVSLESISILSLKKADLPFGLRHTSFYIAVATLLSQNLRTITFGSADLTMLFVMHRRWVTQAMQQM